MEAMDSEAAQRQGEAIEWSKALYMLAGLCFAALCFVMGRASVTHAFRPWYAAPSLFVAASCLAWLAERVSRSAHRRAFCGRGGTEGA